MQKLRFIYIIISLLLIIQDVFAQTDENEVKAEVFYNAGDFHGALHYYKAFSSRTSNLSDFSKIKMANCFYFTRDYISALELLKKMDENFIPDSVLVYFAKSLIYKEEYERAIAVLEKAKIKSSKNKMIDVYIENCNWAQKNKNETANYKAEKTEIINIGQSFGTQFYDKGLVFSTALDEGKDYLNNYKFADNAGRAFKKLYYASYNDGKTGKPVLFASGLKYDYHQGGISFSADYKTMYFSENVIVNNKSVFKIYKAEKKNNKWVNKQELNINSNEYSCAQPTVSYDGSQLYFVSDMPGGQGGKDIYVSKKEGTKWGAPVNLGEKINTKGDEVFPFVNKNGILYFSSDGHPGFGGLDIQTAVWGNNEWVLLKNRMKPFNSSADDFAMVSSFEDPSQILLSSNREGNGQNDFIYRLIKLAVLNDTIRGIIKNAVTGYVIPEAAVFLSSDTLQTDTIASSKTDINGAYMLVFPKQDESVFRQNLYIIASGENFDKQIMKIDALDFESHKGVTKKHNFTMKDKPKKKQKPRSISGVIKDALTDKNLKGVSVFVLVDELTGDTLAYTITNDAGEYNLTIPQLAYNEEKKELLFVIEREGYEKKTINITEDFYESDKPFIPDFDVSMKIEIKKEMVIEFHNIYFDYGKADLNAPSIEVLERIVKVMQENNTMSIELSAHTDSRSDSESNKKLSQKRADNARDYLVSKGIPVNRIVAKGYGESQLRNHCKDGVTCSE